MTHEQKFLHALKDVFIGAPVEGESGYINLMRIKARYFEQGIAPRLLADVRAALTPFPTFREELFDKLYSFFHRYFSESGSIYFRYTPLHQNVYARVYTDDRDVMLFWKTHMLYYVKTDRLFQNMEIKVDNFTFFFDVSTLQHKQSNEKRALVYDFAEVRADGTLVFTVAYSERGSKTKMTDIQRALRAANAEPREEVLERAFRLFERQSEVDYFINKDARAFLREQFDLWMYQYVFSEEGTWTAVRIQQLQVLRDIAYKLIDFIAQFEDELVKVWNKPKFARGSHYVITLDRIAYPSADEGALLRPPTPASLALLKRILEHPGMVAQVAEWHDLGMVGEEFKPEDMWQRDSFGQRLDDAYQYLPLDTRHFPDLELEILGMFGDLDEALDGWLVHSENYQALRTMEPKFRGQVRVVYIDPPYNTGKDEFVYRDVFRHSSWLSMMSDRLLAAVNYVDSRGAILVSVDEVECAKLEENMRGIFGPENYVATYIWEGGRKNDSRLTSISHEYIVGFAKDLALLTQEKATWQIRKEGIDHIYRKANSLKRELGEDYYQISLRLSEWFDGLPDNHPAKRQRQYWAADKRGVYFPSDIGWHGGDGPQYEVIHPVTKQACKIPERGWMYPTEERMLEAIADDRVHFWEDHTKVPSAKAYLKDNEFEVLNSVFYQDRRGATKRLRNMIGRDASGKDVFPNPKDDRIIAKFFLAIGNTENIFLDFFAGSGTTAHAVMNLNREDGGRRKYVLVEMADYFNVVILPRIKKAAFSNKWKDKKARPGGQGMSHFVKYYTLEQYEDTLRLARYEDADLFQNPYADPYSSYVFLRDLKMLEAVDLNTETESVTVHLERLYPDIDLAETLSCVTGKPIKRITAEEVEFRDGTRADLVNPDWELVKPLIWW